MIFALQPFPLYSSWVWFYHTSNKLTDSSVKSCFYIIAAEQKARTTYDNIVRFCDDPDVRDPSKFLRQREIVHYQRFGEGLRLATDKLNYKNFYAFNPSFDKVKSACPNMPSCK